MNNLYLYLLCWWLHCNQVVLFFSLSTMLAWVVSHFVLFFCCFAYFNTVCRLCLAGDKFPDEPLSYCSSLDWCKRRKQCRPGSWRHGYRWHQNKQNMSWWEYELSSLWCAAHNVRLVWGLFKFKFSSLHQGKQLHLLPV